MKTLQLVPTFTYTYDTRDAVASGTPAGIFTNTVNASTIKLIAKPRTNYRVYVTVQSGQVLSVGSTLFDCMILIKLNGATTHNLQRTVAKYPSDIAIMGNRRTNLNVTDAFCLQDRWQDNPYFVATDLSHWNEICTTVVQVGNTSAPLVDPARKIVVHLHFVEF